MNPTIVACAIAAMTMGCAGDSGYRCFERVDTLAFRDLFPDTTGRPGQEAVFAEFWYANQNSDSAVVDISSNRFAPESKTTPFAFGYRNSYVDPQTLGWIYADGTVDGYLVYDEGNPLRDTIWHVAGTVDPGLLRQIVEAASMLDSACVRNTYHPPSRGGYDHMGTVQLIAIRGTIARAIRWWPACLGDPRDTVVEEMAPEEVRRLSALLGLAIASAPRVAGEPVR